MSACHVKNNEAGAPVKGAGIIAHGGFPVKHDGVVAEVLFQFLHGKALTGMKAVFDASTTRLARAVHYLEKKYGWHIEREQVTVSPSDGRITTIKKYWLSPEAVTSAKAAGADAWCALTRAVRDKQRAERAKARQKAVLANKAARLARLATGNSVQRNLFEGDI